MEIKMFDRWSTDGIEIKDPSLKGYISLKPVVVPKSHGRHTRQFYKSEISIVERLINHMFVPGHKSKKHFRYSGKCGGKTMTMWNVIIDTFNIIEEKTKKNPIEVFVRAIENSALREEIASFQLGGIIVRKAVVASPQRRVDMALRLIVQSSFQKATKGGKPIAGILSDEIIAAYKNDAANSFAIKERERIEKEAAGAR